MSMQQGTFAEKDEQLRQMLTKLDAIDTDAAVAQLTQEDIVNVRRQLADNQSLIRETIDRLRQSTEENEMHVRRRDELEARITGLETEYDELLGAFILVYRQRRRLTHMWLTEKTIHDENADVDVAKSMAEVKASTLLVHRFDMMLMWQLVDQT